MTASLDVLPRLALDDGVDVGAAESILISDDLEIVALESSITDEAHIVFDELASPTEWSDVGSLNLVKVLPSPPPNGITQYGDLHSVEFSYLSLRLACLGASSRVEHDGVGQYGRCIQLSSLFSGWAKIVLYPTSALSSEVSSITGVSTPLFAIGHVVCMSAIEQVLGATTRRVITGVPCVIGYLPAISKHESYPVSSGDTVFLVAVSVVRDSEEAVFLSDSRSTEPLPFPTRVFVIDDVDLGPEAHLQCGQGEWTCLEQVSFVLSDLSSESLEVLPHFSDLRFQFPDRFPALVPIGEGTDIVIVFSHDGIIAGVETTEMGVLEPTHIDLIEINFFVVSPAQEVM